MATPHQPDQAQVVATTQDLTVALNGVETRLGEAIEQGLAEAKDEGKRKLRQFLAGAVVLIMLAAVIVSVIQLHDSQISGCQAGNGSRAQQVQLWDHLVSISKPPQGESAAQASQQKHEVGQFLAYVHRVFAQRNCAKTYPFPLWP
jgi:hypothetical protein